MSGPDIRSLLTITAVLALAPMTPVTAQSDTLSQLHDRYGAPGSIQREQAVTDLRERIARGEISPFKILLTDALPIDAPNWSPGPIFYDNFRIEGELAP